MSAVAEPKKPYAKKPTKWQWRLAAGRLNKGVATSIEGEVLSAMSLTAYMTCRDIANAIRIDPTHCQSRLTKLLSKGAVERRIIPGSVHDTAPTQAPPAPPKKTDLVEVANPQFKVGDFVKVHGSEVPAKVVGVNGNDLTLQHGDTGYEWTTTNLGRIAAWPVASLVPGFDPRIVAGSIVQARGMTKQNVVKGVLAGRAGFDTFRSDGSDGDWATTPGFWKFIAQTPNPVAFNKGNYADCFAAPKEEVEAIVYPFAVGEKVMSKATAKVYTVKAFSADAKSMTLADAYNNANHFCFPGDFVKAPTPKPLTPIQEEAKKIVDEIVEGPKAKALTLEVKVEEGRKDDAGKPPLQLLLKYFDARALGAVAEVMDYGAGRYGERNWEKPQLSKERILGAVLRHVGSDLRGDKVDADSKKLHLAHAAASALMALSKELGVCNG